MAVMLSGTRVLPRVVSRAFVNDDFWRIRQLLIDTYPITPTGFNWEIRRWEGWNCHEEHPNKNQLVRLWESEDGQIVGVVHPEGDGDAFFEIHPDYRYLEDEMMEWAEEHLAALNEAGRKQLHIFAYDYDVPRRRLLEQHGYTKMPWSGVIRRMRFGNRPLPKIHMPRGYILRTTRPIDEDDQRIADILNAGFNRTIHTALEFHSFTTHAPSFSHDLHLVAETPEGIFAAFVGLMVDAANHYGTFEPVCTHPDHLRKGLARALMLDGMHRLKALGATDAYVGTGDAVPANALYDAVGFTEAYTGYTWRKVF